MSDSLVMAFDGPRAGSWWLESDWNTVVKSSQRMLEASGTRIAILDYEQDGLIEHPSFIDHDGKPVMGKKMVYRP
jgi:hypothetical protein